MINRNIIDVLHNHNFNIMQSNSFDYLFFGRQSDEQFNSIVVVDDTTNRNAADKIALFTIKDSLERNLLLKGYKNVEILFVISTDSPFSYKSLAEEGLPFWIIDSNAFRIISYTTDDASFDSLRDDIEKHLIPSARKSVSIKSRLMALLKKPFITIALAVINIMIFVYMDLFCSIIDQAVIKLRFSNEWSSILNHGQYYRLFSSMFLHSDMVHVFSNMVTLVAVGLQLEPALGHIKYALIYLASGIIASATSMAYHCYLGETVFSMGASGAIFGVFGAYAVYTLFNKAKGQPIPTFKIALAAILILVNGMTSPYIDNAAHLGGILAGSIFSFICCICHKNKI